MAINHGFSTIYNSMMYVCVLGWDDLHSTELKVNPKTARKVWVCTQHCGYWCPGAKAPGHQYPHCWPTVQYIGPVSDKNITFTVNNIKKCNQILKKVTKLFRVNGYLSRMALTLTPTSIYDSMIDIHSSHFRLSFYKPYITVTTYKTQQPHRNKIINASKLFPFYISKFSHISI